MIFDPVLRLDVVALVVIVAGFLLRQERRLSMLEATVRFLVDERERT